MPLPKIKIPFNPDHMTAHDLKECAETLQEIIKAYNRLPDDLGANDRLLNVLYHAEQRYDVED